VKRHRPGLQTWVAAGVTVIFWASSFAGIRAALAVFSPGHLVLLRFLITSAVLAVYAAVTRMRAPARADWRGLALVGLTGIAAYQLALNYGEMTVTAGAASLIIASGPAFTALFARAVLGESLTGWGWMGIALSIVGVGMIAIGEAQGFGINAGALLVLVAAVFTAPFHVLQKPLLRKYSAQQVGTASIWVATLVLLVFLPGLPEAVRQAPPGALVAVAYLAIFPGAISHLTWSYVLSRMPASIAGSVLYGVYALAIPFAWAWLGEVPSLLSVAGGVVCLAGVVMVNRRGQTGSDGRRDLG
jgi:drug/metabolite transporter (DMT)-like permease